MSFIKRSVSVRKSNSNNKMAAGSTATGQQVASANDGFTLFWDVGNFKRTVKRIDDGAIICDEMVKMVTERAEIEAKYAKKLADWDEKWMKHVEAGPLYGTMKSSMIGVLHEAQERSVVHMECVRKLHNQVVENIKRWKNENYHKAFLNWKETKEVDEEFTKAQKPWADAYAKVNRAKKNYHMACRSYETSTHALSEARQDESFTPEKSNKIEETVRKHEKTVTRTRKKYEEKLQRIEPLNTSYESEMTTVFEKCQSLESKRLAFFQDTLIEFHKSLNVCDDSRLSQIFQKQLQQAYSANVKHDLMWWSNNHGAGMPRNWPKFEELGDDPPSPIVPKQMTANGLDANGPSTPYIQTNPIPNNTVQNNNANNQRQISVQYDDEKNPFEDGDDEWDLPPEENGVSNPVQALYDYVAEEPDELSFKAGDIITRLSEEDEQGWCKGRKDGREGLFPANYVAAMS